MKALTIKEPQQVRALLDGSKTQHRLLVTPRTFEMSPRGDWGGLDFKGATVFREYAQPGFAPPYIDLPAPLPRVDGTPEGGQYLHVPYRWDVDQRVYRLYPRVAVGEKLWVQETWYQYADGRVLYRASDNSQNYFSWRPSIFMPRWASRITLEITGIRVERLQEISDDDVLAEGILPIMVGDSFEDGIVGGMIERDRYKELWDKLNPKHNWEANDFVEVLEFKRVEKEG